jgi:predicted  nucleic acid-binding Zn-ribbon protein
MTGPYWEMTNVKVAAIVRSKKYDYVDDYEYINAYYRDPLELNSSQRTEVESELKNVLGKNNMKLQAINTKVDSLTNELSLTKEQSQNLTAEISTLENELTSLKSSESEIQNQISDLSNQFNSKESLIVEKTQNLASLQDQLNPLSDKMTELEGQKAELDTKLNNQLNTIVNQIESKGQATEEANTLKAQFESQITELDTQLQKIEKQSVEINTQLTSLTTELTSLETETPNISNQISKLNQELKDVIEIKADLAMTQAMKSGITVNEKIVASVAKLENKSIIQIEGTNLMRVVDTNTLTDQAGNFEAPVGTFTKGNQVYLAGAVTREQILSVGKFDVTGDLNIQLSQIASEKINSGMFGLDAAKGLVATDSMAKGTYSLIDPKTGRQVLDSHTGNALYGGIICDGDQCGPSGDLGKKVAASGYAFVRTGDINQGGMCSDGNCAFNISSSELQTFNKQIADGVESPFGYDDALAAATINTKGLVADTVSEAAGTVTKEFFSGKFNVMTEVGGQEELVQKAKDAVSRLQAAQASGEKIDASAIQTAQNQVAAEQSVLDAVNAAKAAATSTTQVAAAAAAASAAASEAAETATEAAKEVVETQRAAQNVNQLIQYADGSIHHLTGKTGVNVSAGQTVIWSGLTSETHGAYGSETKKRAIEEAAAATGISSDQIYNPDN